MSKTKDLMRKATELESKVYGEIATKLNSEATDSEDAAPEYKKVQFIINAGQAGAPINSAMSLLEDGKSINSAALVINLIQANILQSENSFEENRESFFKAVDFFKNEEQELKSKKVAEAATKIWNIITPVIKVFIDAMEQRASARLETYETYFKNKKDKEKVKVKKAKAKKTKTKTKK